MTLTTLAGGRPRRTRSSTSATAARPTSGVKSSRAPHRLPPGHPHGLGDRRDLAEELDGGRSAADDDGAPAPEVVTARVVDGVQLLAGERLDAGVVRHERRPPGAGRVDERPGRPACGRRLRSDQQAVLVVDTGPPGPAGRPACRVALVVAKYAGTASLAGRRTPGGSASGRAAIPCTSRMLRESQRCCQAPPGDGSASSTTCVDAAAAQVVRRRQAGLAGADHHRVEDLHACPTTRGPDVLPQVSESPASSAISTIAAERLLALLRRRLLAGDDVVGDGADRQRLPAVLRGQRVERAGLHLDGEHAVLHHPRGQLRDAGCRTSRC